MAREQYTYGTPEESFFWNRERQPRTRSGIVGKVTFTFHFSESELSRIVKKQNWSGVLAKESTEALMYLALTGENIPRAEPEPAVADNDAIAEAVTDAFKTGATEAQIREKMLASGLKLAVVDKYLPRTAKKAPAFDFGL